MVMSAAHKEAYARAQVDVRHLMAVELAHSAFPSGRIRLVDYPNDITVDGAEYTGHAMVIKEPEISTEADNQLTVTIDGVSGILQPLLYDASQEPEIVFVTLRPFGFNLTTSSVIGVIGVLELEMTGAAVTAEQVSMSCGYVNSANQDFPSIKYTPESHPGLYT